MRIVIVGGTGHIGTYLVPRLVTAGHEVIVLSRGRRQPYQENDCWQNVQLIQVDREASEAEGAFGKLLRDLQPDALVDLICFRESSAQHLIKALRGRVQHLLHCGTIWVHGHMGRPVREDRPRRPISEYGVNKAAIEALFLQEARDRELPVTILHPGHIVGPGWPPLNPQGNFNVDVFSKLARGEALTLPDDGLPTLHHVHADDVAQAFELALKAGARTFAHSFHVASPAALPLRDYARAVAGWFGREANLVLLPWDQWQSTVSEEDSLATGSHIEHSSNVSISKTEQVLGYRPRYPSDLAVREAVEWLAACRRIPAMCDGGSA